MIVLQNMSTKTEEQNKLLAFQMWIELMFLEWQAQKKERSTLDEFAKYIGYSRSLISMWMTGKRLPTDDAMERLAELFGDDIYGIMGITPPNPYLRRVTKIWERIPSEGQRQLAEDAEKYEVKNERSRKPSPKRKTS